MHTKINIKVEADLELDAYIEEDDTVHGLYGYVQEVINNKKSDIVMALIEGEDTIKVGKHIYLKLISDRIEITNEEELDKLIESLDE